MPPPIIILASKSPRRRLLLAAAGIPCQQRPAPLDDGHLTPSQISPLAWVTALAYLKARAAADTAPSRTIILGADTVVIKNNIIIGQPRSDAHARQIIQTLRNGTHTVATGVAILTPNAPRLLFVDTATVTVGNITDSQINDYLATGTHQGKAGAYNLAERQAAGWPLICNGDPATVMGLPMIKLAPILRNLSRSAPIADTKNQH